MAGNGRGLQNFSRARLRTPPYEPPLHEILDPPLGMILVTVGNFEHVWEWFSKQQINTPVCVYIPEECGNCEIHNS